MFRNEVKGLLLYAGTGLLLILLAAVFLSDVRTKEGKPDARGATKLKVAGKEVIVELALTAWEHQQGLKHRRWLPDGHGMLFVFPEESRHSFWMKDTYIPISIAFISNGGIITQIESMEPLSLRSHVSREAVKYALEMTGGWFERNNVKVGDKVELPPEILKN